MLSNDTIRLRALEPDDLDILYIWENDTSMWGFGNNIAPFSRKQLAEYIETYDGDIFKALQLRFMIVSVATDTPMGMIDLYDFDAVNRRAAVGVMVDTAMRGQGYGSQALDMLCRYCYDRLGLHQLYAAVAVDNAPSKSLFEGCKFKTCGRLRSWQRRGESYTDAYILQRLLTPAGMKNDSQE